MWLPGQRHQVPGIQRDHRGAPEGEAEDRGGIQALGSALERAGLAARPAAYPGAAPVQPGVLGGDGQPGADSCSQGEPWCLQAAAAVPAR